MLDRRYVWLLLDAKGLGLLGLAIVIMARRTNVVRHHVCLETCDLPCLAVENLSEWKLPFSRLGQDDLLN